MTDQLFEVYVRNADGDTHHTDLRTGLREFLDPENGYRISLNIEGVVITLRNSWDRETSSQLAEFLDDRNIECLATIRGL